MDLFLQRCFDGLFNGAIYASLALALVMLFRATGLLNFALGEIGMVGGYTSLVMLTPAAAAAGGGGFVFPVAGTSTKLSWQEMAARPRVHWGKACSPVRATG